MSGTISFKSLAGKSLAGTNKAPNIDLKSFGYLPKIEKMKKNVAQLVGTSVGLVGVLVFPYVLFSALNEHCIANNNKCIEIPPFSMSIPTDATASLLGASSGAIFTFLTLYLLEKVKRNLEPKPQLKITLNKKEKDELVVDSIPHYIFVPGIGSGESYQFGNAHYLRVKVTNEGKKIANGCKGYLTDIQENSSGQFQRVEGSEGSMRLLWAYEQKGNYRSNAAEHLPAGASDYLDILVSYDHELKPDSSNNSNEWFLKLKTQPQPSKYAKLIKIVKSENITYQLTVKVYGDECTPAEITLVLEHNKNSQSVNCSVKGDPSIIEFKLCDPAPSKPLYQY